MSEKNSMSMFQEFLNGLKGLCDNFLLEMQSEVEVPQPQQTEIKRGKGHKKLKKLKDPLAPKMPTSAFIFYFQDKKDKFVKQYPNLKFSEITKLIASEWKDLPKEKQQIFTNLADQDRKRYQKDHEEYARSTNNRKVIQKITKAKAKKAKKVKLEVEEVLEMEQDSFGADIGQE